MHGEFRGEIHGGIHGEIHGKIHREIHGDIHGGSHGGIHETSTKPFDWSHCRAHIQREPRRYRQLDQVPKLRYSGLNTLATSNPEMQATGNWARNLGLGTWPRYPGLNTLATSNLEIQAIGI